MRVPSFARFQRLMQLTAFFVCGLIVGAAVFNALKIEQYDSLAQENVLLTQRLAELTSDLKQAEQIRKTNVIKSIQPFILEQAGKPELGVATEAEIKKRLKKDLDIFIGRSIYNIDTDAPLARKLLNKIVYEDIGGQDYEVSVQTMLVADGRLQIWVNAIVHLPK